MHVSMGLKHLKSINLSFCLSISDSGLKYLAKMPSLCELNLRSCDNISDVGMAYLAEGGSRITSLDVSFCDRIDDQAVVHVAQGLVHLKQLSLSACHVSDEGLIRVALSLLDLQTLNIGQCSRITDRSIQAVADHLRKLRCIGKHFTFCLICLEYFVIKLIYFFSDLYGCTKITTSGLERIMKLPQLSVLNLGLWHIR